MNSAILPARAAACIVVLLGSVVLAEGERERVKPYRVIFNCDGHAVAKDSGGDLNQWINNLFGPLAESHVDALFWCDGAGGNTANYVSQVLEPTGKRVGKPRPYIAKWIKEGHDPPEVVVREAKKRGLDVFYSFRINDIYLFNWFPHSYNNSEATGPYMSGLLKQLGDPDVLRARQRRLMFAADRGRPGKCYPHNWMHCVLPAALSTERELEVSIRVGEDFRQAAATPALTLRAEVENLQDDDRVEIEINGRPVEGLRRSAERSLSATVEPDQVARGVNEVTLKLRERSPKSADPRTVTALELGVVFPDLVMPAQAR